MSESGGSFQFYFQQIRFNKSIQLMHLSVFVLPRFLNLRSTYYSFQNRNHYVFLSYPQPKPQRKKTLPRQQLLPSSVLLPEAEIPMQELRNLPLNKSPS